MGRRWQLHRVTQIGFTYCITFVTKYFRRISNVQRLRGLDTMARAVLVVVWPPDVFHCGRLIGITVVVGSDVDGVEDKRNLFGLTGL